MLAATDLDGVLVAAGVLAAACFHDAARILVVSVILAVAGAPVVDYVLL
jgi:hypothetical protein